MSEILIIGGGAAGMMAAIAAADNGKALFTETYAKIIEKKDSSLTLCFTHVNRSFQSFAGQLWDHIERD